MYLSPISYPETQCESSIGHWKGATEIPNTSFEDAEKELEGEDKIMFLEFIRRMVKWLPEERSTAKQLLKDPWLKVSRN